MTCPRAKDYMVLPLHCRECNHLWGQKVTVRARTVPCPRCKSPKTEVQKPEKILDFYKPTYYNHHPALGKRQLETANVQPGESIFQILEGININDLIVDAVEIVEETA